jgi:CRISPR-associated protein Cas2
MFILITYDVSTMTNSGKKRLNKVAKQCKNYGQRVQNSVFECLLEPAMFVQLRGKLEEIIDMETDSLRYYFFGNDWRSHVEHVGAKKSIDLEGTIIV